MPDTAEVVALRAEITALKAGTLGLAAQVETLSGALTALNDLQRVQREQQAEIAHVRAVVVPRDEHVRKDAELRAELTGYRRRLVRKMFTWALVGVVVLLGVGIFTATYIDSLRQQSYENCRAGAATGAAARDYLIAVRDNSTNPKLAQSADQLVRKFAPRDCEALR